MTENASLSDYLFELRRGAPASRLTMAMGLGALTAAVGVFMGPMFVGLIGLGLGISGVCSWARLNQIADSLMDGGFGAEPPARAKRIRAVGVVALGIAAVGGLLFFYSFAFRFVLLTKGM